MAFTPNTRVYLLDTPLNNKNQLHFNSVENQQNYFFSQQKHVFADISYVRKDNKITIASHIDNLWDVNYVMYQNANFGTKWFYAYITKMEYVGDRATDVYIETDVYQTWLFECQLMQSFTVREHVADDTIGKHLVDEGLETGEYKMETYDPLGEMGDYYNILAVSDNSPLGNTDPIGNIYGNVVTGLTYFPFPNDAYGVAWLKATIELYAEAGKTDAIVMIFTVPQFLIPLWETLGQPITTGSPQGYKTVMIPKQITDLDGYTPRNNKMFTHPYKYFYVSNNVGGSAVYRYEDFINNDMQFTLLGSIMPDPTLMLAPSQYKGADLSVEHGLTLKGFPLCSWNTDTFTAWFAQNAGSMAINTIGSFGTILGGGLTGNMFAIGGGAYAIASQMGQLYKASVQPDQAKGQIGAGSLQFSTNSLDYYTSHMTIKAEYAKRIDDYFTMYGYKVNTLKVPETHSRQRWNYIQTIDVNIKGAIPADDMAKLKTIYNEGVTLWHNPSEFLRYDLSNTII